MVIEGRDQEDSDKRKESTFASPLIPTSSFYFPFFLFFFFLSFIALFKQIEANQLLAPKMKRICFAIIIFSSSCILVSLLYFEGYV